jgi:hypothetical protein
MGGVVLGNLLFGGSKGENVEGSRLSDLSVQTSTYGGTIQLSMARCAYRQRDLVNAA